MIEIAQGDCLEVLDQIPAESFMCCVTSPPYFHQRDYGHEKQIGLEETADLYVEKIDLVFRKVSRVLKPEGTIWINIGDSYNGYFGNHTGTSLESNMQKNRPYFPTGTGLRCKKLKNKDLIGVPWRVAFKLQESGLYLRADNIWAKPDPKPESRVFDRPHRSHEYIFLFSKQERYFFDKDSINRIPGIENSVWNISTRRPRNSHSADYPPDLAEACILMGTNSGDSVIDPFAGSGSTLSAAEKLGRSSFGIEINHDSFSAMHKKFDTSHLFGFMNG